MPTRLLHRVNNFACHGLLSRRVQQYAHWMQDIADEVAVHISSAVLSLAFTTRSSSATRQIVPLSSPPRTFPT